jgi:hypothetical protein
MASEAVEKTKAFIRGDHQPFVSSHESLKERWSRIGRSSLFLAKHAVTVLPVGTSISRVVTGLYYLSHYGPLAFYSSEIVDAISLLARLVQSVEGKSWMRLMGGDLPLKIYYLIAEERGRRFTEKPIANGVTPSQEVMIRLERYCGLAVHIAYEASVIDAQRLLRLQGYTLVVANQDRRKSHTSTYRYFVACREKEVVVILPGTQGIGDIAIDINAFESDISGHKMHRGIHLSAEILFKKLESSLVLFSKGGFAIRVVGHSLGAGIGSILTYLLRTHSEVKDIHCFGFGCPPCVSASFGDSLNDTVTNVVLRDDLVCRASVRNLNGLIDLLSSEAVSSRTRRFINNDWRNLKANWVSFFKLNSRPAVDDQVFRIETENKSLISSWFNSIRTKWSNIRQGSSSIHNRTPIESPGLWLPGKIVFISSFNSLGQLTACFLDRTHPILSNIQLQTEMLNDHKGDMYFKALVQVNQSLHSSFFRTPKSSPQTGDRCSCCGGDFLWNSVLKGEPHVWLAKQVCKKCGVFVCDACSRNYRAVPEHGFLWPVRHCDRCYLSTSSRL